MRYFNNGARVRIEAEYHPLRGREAIVVRRRMADDGAWCAVQGEITEEDRAARVPEAYSDSSDRCFPFPADDSRGTHTLLYPDECEEVAHG